jgi:hypothetical protein
VEESITVAGQSPLLDKDDSRPGLADSNDVVGNGHLFRGALQPRGDPHQCELRREHASNIVLGRMVKFGVNVNF